MQQTNNKQATCLLLQGLKGADREDMLNRIKASAPVLKRLEEVIDKELKKLSEDSPDFEKSSWAYEQAYKLGLQKGLTTFKKYVIIKS